MAVPNHDFGGLIRRGREQLGLSHTRVAELVGRAPSTLRTWERGGQPPADPNVVSSLAAVLGVDEAKLFEAAGLDPPLYDAAPRLDDAYRQIAPGETDAPRSDVQLSHPIEDRVVQPSVTDRHAPDPDDRPTSVEAPVRPPTPPGPARAPARDVIDSVGGLVRELRRRLTSDRSSRRLARRPPTVGAPRPPAHPSYLEDPEQRLGYQLRSLYTAVGVALLLVVLIWAAGELLEALSVTWESLVQNL